MLYVTNAFSINMLDRVFYDIFFHPITQHQAEHLLKAEDWVSAVGHEDTARVFSDQLNHKIEPNRTTVQLGEDDMLLVGQYTGPRLPEGASRLPEGATINWWLVTPR